RSRRVLAVSIKRGALQAAHAAPDSPPAGLDGHGGPVARCAGCLSVGPARRPGAYQRGPAPWPCGLAPPPSPLGCPDPAPNHRCTAAAVPGLLPQGRPEFLGRPFSLL